MWIKQLMSWEFSELMLVLCYCSKFESSSLIVLEILVWWVGPISQTQLVMAGAYGRAKSHPEPGCKEKEEGPGAHSTPLWAQPQWPEDLPLTSPHLYKVLPPRNNTIWGPSLNRWGFSFSFLSGEAVIQYPNYSKQLAIFVVRTVGSILFNFILLKMWDLKLGSSD